MNRLLNLHVEDLQKQADLLAWPPALIVMWKKLELSPIPLDAITYEGRKLKILIPELQIHQYARLIRPNGMEETRKISKQNQKKATESN